MALRSYLGGMHVDMKSIIKLMIIVFGDRCLEQGSRQKGLLLSQKKIIGYFYYKCEVDKCILIYCFWVIALSKLNGRLNVTPKCFFFF